MQTVSELYPALWRTGRHKKEHRAIIAGVVHDESVIIGVPQTFHSLFGKNGPAVGECNAAQLELQVLPLCDIPRMAEIKLQTRLAADKYAISGVVFWRQLEGWFVVHTPDNQTYYFLPNCIYGLEDSRVAVHYATLYWSVSGGLTGVSGGTRTEDDGSLVSWESPVEFTQTAPEQYSDFLKLASWHLDGMECSPWIPKGTFYIDTRKLDEETGVLTINGYDAMLKSEVQFLQEGDTGEWPRASSVIVGEICELMGVELDERTELDDEIKVPYPNDWTAREILSMVGTAHCANWTITDAGKLRLVPLWSIPEATHYLVDQYGDPITLGGVRILV